MQMEKGKILLFKPLSVTANLRLGPAVVTDGWVVSSAAPAPGERAKM